VRHSQVRDYKQAFNRYILPRFKGMSLADLRTKDLTVFQAELLKTGLAVKTVRNIIDSSFRAMFRDARTEHEELKGRDPFLDIKSESKTRTAGSAKQRGEAQSSRAFLEHEPFYYPFVRVQYNDHPKTTHTGAGSQ
jgi:hypothetical protein